MKACFDLKRTFTVSSEKTKDLCFMLMEVLILQISVAKPAALQFEKGEMVYLGDIGGYVARNLQLSFYLKI